jgi:transposase
MKLEEQIDNVNRELAQFASKEESCRRLLTVPGIGPLTATALVAAIGKGTAFHKARILQHGLVWFPSSIQPVELPD